MTSRTFDVAIVGAGIVGAACAVECARAGLAVTVIEGVAPGAGTTGAATGHVVVMADSEAQFALTRYSRDLWEQAAEALPPDVGYQRRGTLWVAIDDDEMVLLERKRAFYESHGVEANMLDADELVRMEPNLRRGLTGGLFLPGDRVLDPLAATRAFLQQAEAHGAVVRVGRPAVRLEELGVRLVDESLVRAERVINAAGCSSPALTPGLPVRKRKGHLAMTQRRPGFLRHQVAEAGYLKSVRYSADSVAFNVQPRATGEVVVGSSRQYAAEEGSVDPAVLERMLARAGEFMPELRKLPIARVWAGFRPASPDGLPLIGPFPASDHILLATGHEGLGITTSLGTARLLLAMLQRRSSAIPVGPYLPSRLSGSEVWRGPPPEKSDVGSMR